ncbi:MAG: hypothetical protein IKC87_00655 [Clostridia bacterium]|nr:hypothetical protein [Clostridia bacterium]
MKHQIYERYPLGNKRFKWRQKDFVLSNFAAIGRVVDGDPKEVLDNNIRYLKETGFNMTELGWACHEGAWAAVEACEKYGLDLIFQDMTIMGGMQNHCIENKVSFDVPKKLVETLKPMKHTIGYYVWDEPHSEEQMAEARRQMDMLEELDPEALLFTVGLPNYNNAGPEKKGYNWENGEYVPYIDRFIKTMDPPVLSFDYYPVGNYFNCWSGHRYNYDEQMDTTYMWLDLAAYRKKGLENGLPLWFYYQGCQLYKSEDPEMFIFPMVRVCMYGGALYGAKGLQHYEACFRDDLAVCNPKGEKGRFFEDQKKIHAEFHALGNTLMALESTLVYHSEDLLPGDKFMAEWCDKLSDSTLFSTLPSRTSVGEFKDAYGNKYIMVLNRDYLKPLKTSIPMNGSYRLYEVSKADGKQSVYAEATTALELDLAPGDAILLRVQNSADEAFTCEYKLAE